MSFEPSRSSVRGVLTCGLALLLSCCAASPASARAPKSKPATDVIELELRELGEHDRTVEFVVPLDGRIAGWTELLGEPHFCRFDAEQLQDQRASLRMRCGRDRDLGHLDFDFSTIRALEDGAPTLLAELTARDGARLQVVVTRR